MGWAILKRKGKKKTSIRYQMEPSAENTAAELHSIRGDVTNNRMSVQRKKAKQHIEKRETREASPVTGHSHDDYFGLRGRPPNFEKKIQEAARKTRPHASKKKVNYLG